MRETVEFRVPETLADRFLPPGVGVRLGIARKLEVAADDPLFTDIGEIDARLRRDGRAFFTAWIPHRRYSRGELRAARLLHVSPKKVFEPAGEEAGTKYDESTACEICGAGAVQVGSLVLPEARIPRNVDFAQTIAGEIVATTRACEVFREAGLTGAVFDPVLSAETGAPSSDHFQLNVVGPTPAVAATTRAGADPFDEHSTGRCARGHVVGLNLLSEIQVAIDAAPSTDVIATREMFGVRRGLLRPRPAVLVSPTALVAIENARLTGLRVEVARVGRAKRSA